MASPFWHFFLRMMWQLGFSVMAELPWFILLLSVQYFQLATVEWYVLWYLIPCNASCKLNNLYIITNYIIGLFENRVRPNGIVHHYPYQMVVLRGIDTTFSDTPICIHVWDGAESMTFYFSIFSKEKWMGLLLHISLSPRSDLIQCDWVEYWG